MPLLDHIFNTFGIISFSEHNGTFTAICKNLSDWLSRINWKVYEGTKSMLTAVKPGKDGAKSVLADGIKLAVRNKSEVISTISITKFHEKY